MGYSYTSKNGNRMTLCDNGMVDITPKDKSTMFLTVDEIVSMVLHQNSNKGGKKNGRTQ